MQIVTAIYTQSSRGLPWWTLTRVNGSRERYPMKEVWYASSTLPWVGSALWSPKSRPRDDRYFFGFFAPALARRSAT
jgi:hypothetical protein